MKPENEEVERIAQAFHEDYERLAPSFGYGTREASAVPWADVPAKNKGLMRATVASLIQRKLIYSPDDAGGVYEQGYQAGRAGRAVLS